MPPTDAHERRPRLGVGDLDHLTDGTRVWPDAVTVRSRRPVALPRVREDIDAHAEPMGRPGPVPVTGAAARRHRACRGLHRGRSRHADLRPGCHLARAFITGAVTPGWTIEVDAEHIYWTSWKHGRIDRADLDGTNLDQDFITGASNPLGVTVDSTEPARQPDGLISKTSTTRGFVGDGIYAATALASQTVTRTADRTKRTYAFWVRVQNDAAVADRFLIRGTATRTKGVKVAYVVGGVDRTATIVAGRFKTRTKAPGTSVTVVVKVTVPAGSGAAMAKVRLIATSAAAPTAIDVVRAVVQR